MSFTNSSKWVFVRQRAWIDMCNKYGDPFLTECDVKRDEFFHEYEQTIWERIQQIVVQEKEKYSIDIRL